MTIPDLRKTALICAVIGALSLLAATGALAQVALSGDSGELPDDEGQFRSAVPSDQSKVVENKHFPRATYVWPHATGPSYDNLESGLVAGSPGVVITPVGMFRIGSGMSQLPSELRKPLLAAGQGGRYFFAFLSEAEGVLEGLTADLARSGGGVVEYEPNARVATVRVFPATQLQSLPGVVAVEPYHPALKLNPTIGRIPHVDPTAALSEVYELDAILFPGEDPVAVAGAITALGGDVHGTRDGVVTFAIHRAQLGAVAAIEAVQIVEERMPYVLMAEETTVTMQTGGYNQGASPYHDAGIDGSGGGGVFGFCSVATTVGCTTVPSNSCTGGQGTCNTATYQRLLVVDTGIQVDAGDLSHQRTSSGWGGANVVAGHRKVLTYETTNQFNTASNPGFGDLQGCDLSLNGGRTHGHIVAATAIGNGTDVAASYNGPGWLATDQQDELWSLDGVAKGGRLVAYDGQITPASSGCDNPIVGFGNTLRPGELYLSGGTTADSFLQKAREVSLARSMNISFGKTGNTYSQQARDIDEFLFDYQDSMVYISAGNLGTDLFGDGIADELSLQQLATSKNALAIGASRNADRTDQPESRAFFSSTGPAVNTTLVNRTAPHLMAPGEELNGGTLGLSSEFACRTLDNDQNDPVDCDIFSGNEGTSFASPAAAGAGMLVRDYFGQGFYPNGARDLTEAVPNVSGRLVKAALIASADFMTGANVSRVERFNNEQGYGRIQLDNVLPLETWAGSPSGMIVVDNVAAINDFGGGITGSMNTTGAAQSATFQVCNDKEELRAALTWIDRKNTSGAILSDLNLRLTSPSGIVYRGNYFTDDSDKDGTSEASEDCPGIGDLVLDGEIDADEWSQPVCANTGIEGIGSPPAITPFDSANIMEAIFLSPNADGVLEDTDGDGQVDTPTYVSGICSATTTGGLLGQPCGRHQDCAGGNGYQTCVTGVSTSGDCCDGGDLQTEPGTWTLEVSRGNTLANVTPYSVVIAGGVCPGTSSVLVNQASYTCNGAVEIVVKEDTAGLAATAIAQRITVQVIKEDDTVADEEDLDSLTPIEFTEDSDRRFASNRVLLSSGSYPEPGNGVLDVNDGDRIKVIYTDLESGKTRTALADVNCTVDLTVNSVLNIQFGQDSSVVFFGGCERNVRGKFELAGLGGFGGFPDRYLDADEFIQVDFIFQSDELVDLETVEVGLSCVITDANSPADCLPDGTGCISGGGGNCGGGNCDPRREDNPSCDGTIDEGTSQTAGTQYMTIVDPQKSVGLLPGLSTLGSRFSIQMAGDGSGQPFFGSPQPQPVVELLLRVADPTSGKSSPGLGVNRIRLNSDANVIEYSTDFPMGGTAVELKDLNENEVIEDPIFEPEAGFQGIDYRFETRTFGNLLVGKNAAGSTINRNQNLKAPWNFDGNDGGFTAGLGARTDEALVATEPYNWGEDKNFNNVEDGHCGGDLSIRCFKIGAGAPTPSDPRCAHLPGLSGNRACVTDEDGRGENTGAFVDFNNNWNTRGGCGFQTKAPSTCDLVTTRGCFTNDDCKGACVTTSNPINSTYRACSVNGDCGTVLQCDSASPAGFDFLTCGKCSVSNTTCRDFTFDSDCPAGEQCNATNSVCNGGTCVQASQECDGAAGICRTAPQVPGQGGVWHTGVINNRTAVFATDAGCFGGPTANCQTYGFIAGTGGGLEWWNFLLTPVIEKVNQQTSDGLSTGDALARIEITNWAWNHQVDLPDNNVERHWELDTDLSKILPVDLTSDDVTLNANNGPWGAFSLGGNPELEDGYGMFAPMGSCGVKNCGGLGTASSGTRCEVTEQCAAGGCSKGTCNVGQCEDCSPPESAGNTCQSILCFTDSDCVNAVGNTSQVATCSAPNPGDTTCANKAECDSKLDGLTATDCQNNPNCLCEGVGDPCFNTDTCVTNFGTDSACTNPAPQDCLQIASPGSEAPCSVDEECAAGECTAGVGTPCHFDAECQEANPLSLCGNGTTEDRAELCSTSDVGVNGLVGGDREGANACFFQGPGIISLNARVDLGLAKPIDDDQDQDLATKVCAGDASVTCETTNDCTFKGTTGPCNTQVGDGADEYVTASGPIRSFDFQSQPLNGPDMRLFTLEDIYGDTGNTFQGALGFVNLQGGTGFEAETGFGESIDDMVIEWREFTLVPDQTDCADGSCATIIIDVDRQFSGQGVVTYRILEQSPYGFACDSTNDVCYPGDPTRNPCIGTCVAVQNDCDLSGKWKDGTCTTPAPANTSCNDLSGGDTFCSTTYGGGSTCVTGDDNDCDNNGTVDVIALMKTEAEPLGEPSIANLASTGVYQGSITVTTFGDSPGVLFAAQIGADAPTVQAQYNDWNDGTGRICENDVVPERQGIVLDGSVIFLDAVCPVQISGVSSTDNGDADDFTDSNETSTVTLSLLNNCDVPLNNCLMRISTNSPQVDCIFNPIVSIPVINCHGTATGCTLPAGTSVTAPPFQYRLKQRAWTCEDGETLCDNDSHCTAVGLTDCVQNTNSPPSATFTMTLVCDEISGLESPQSFSHTLDMNIVYNPGDQTSWAEDFEGSAGAALSAGGTAFYAQNNDAGIAATGKQQSLLNADGYRCQYSDPDWANSGSSGNEAAEVCWPGQSVASGNAVYWQIDGQGIAENKAQPDGRAKTGTRSLYFGVYDQVPATDVTDPFVHSSPNSTIEGAATTNPINLGVNPPPQLSFWHSVSLIDGRRVQNIPTTLSSDRGIVGVQLANEVSGAPIGDWIKIVPYKNAYDTQAAPNFFNCMFDPIDDGNTEDDFFDPTDPNRSIGPSSTCFGQIPGGTTDFCWSCIGDTEGAFDATEVCNGETGSVATSDAPDWPIPPGETGTWLESKFDLSEYKGRRVRLRFLVASTKVGTADTWEGFVDNPDPRDDGWWIDDIEIDSALVNPASFLVDNAANSGLPACGVGCTSVGAFVTVVSEQPTCDGGGNGSALGTPCGNDAKCVQIAGNGATCQKVVNPGTIILAAPGQVVELNALAAGASSVANACQSGALQFQYSADGNVVRPFTEDPVFIDAPSSSTLYELEARCSTVPSCSATVTILALVDCPTTGDFLNWNVLADGCGSFDWEELAAATARNPAIPGNFRVFRGLLSDLRADGGFGDGALVASNLSGTAFLDSAQAVPTASCSNSLPYPSQSYYWLFARQQSVDAGCNADGWSGGGISEVDGKPWTFGLCTGGTGAADGDTCLYHAECKAVAGAGAYCNFYTSRDENDQGGGLPLP